MSIKAILFDLDNTLMDRDWTFQQFALQLIEECLIEVSAEERERLIAYMIESDADGYREKQGYFRELIERLPWVERPDLDELTRYYELNYMTHARAMNHAVWTLEQCRALDLRLGIITNGRSEVQHGKIDQLGLRPFFDTIIVSGDIDIKKPDPRIYRTALERLGTAAEETIIVGDHPRNDIWGAANIGIRGVWLRRAHGWNADLQGGKPWHEIYELNELISLIRS
ncbi:HAD family hydrolase [Paenibacillus lutimineralis]|uniref:HAD family hydrolase n=1 Tax=Paenibacillus lutimineralis TaxID=2707005 RepID=A0A3Q9IA44_9BACL|nr:HAD family hydrolase [Paenibacillus lutimineralis]AZS15981.1 HAD family hydrolase [Paenibacillus lutimineralis]